MIKVLVVVSGLVLLVPDPGKDPRGVTAIVLATGSEGSTITEHVPALRQQLDPFSTRTWNLGVPGFDVILGIGDEASGTIGLGAWHHLAALRDLEDEGQDFRVRKECLEGSCTDGSTELVAGLAHFEGRWRTRAVSRCDEGWDVPPEFRDQAMLSFRKKSATGITAPHGSFEERRLATGLALETEVSSLEELVLKVGEGQQTLDLSDPSICAAWIGPRAPKCVVFELENWPDVPVDPQCDCRDEASIPDRCKLDTHFGAFYELLVTTPPPNERWLPYVEEGYCSCSGDVSGPGNPPAIRCPPPSGVAEP